MRKGYIKFPRRTEEGLTEYVLEGASGYHRTPGMGFRHWPERWNITRTGNEAGTFHLGENHGIQLS